MGPVGIPVRMRCACRKPAKLPVTLNAEFWMTLRILLANVDAPAETVVFVGYCRHCSSERDVTLADLALDAGQGVHHMLGVDNNGAPHVVGGSSG